MTGHTPGPWRYALSGPKEHPTDTIVILAPNEDAGKSGVSYGGAEIAIAQLDWEPDARLIAAAPDLLAATSGAISALVAYSNSGRMKEEHTDKDGYCAPLRRLNDAIRKACGEEPQS